MFLIFQFNERVYNKFFSSVFVLDPYFKKFNLKEIQVVLNRNNTIEQVIHVEEAGDLKNLRLIKIASNHPALG